MYILYSRGTSPTGRRLREALGIDGGTVPREQREDVLIRWGSSTRVRYRPQTVINSAQAIELATQKLRSLAVMRGSHVAVPDVFMPDNLDIPADFFPVLGRKINHTQGRDIVLCMQREDVHRAVAHELSDFFVRYVPTSREFRVHVFENEVIKISEKVLTDVERFRLPWIRNFENGYTFRNPRALTAMAQTQIETQAIGAVQALGLTFGAVDVILGDNAAVYVLEVNTGPSLADGSLEIYARRFARMLNIPEENLVLPEELDEPEEEFENML